MWDAQQNYWAGHEWNSANPWQPVLNGYGGSGNVAQDFRDPRYYSGGSYATQSFATLPLLNVNEMAWYAAKGDPRWDGDELWTAMGHLHKGGMWFKKKAYISGYNANTTYDGNDWRITSGIYSGSVSQILPSAADVGNYFYLPALGYYYYGQLSNVGYGGYYWTSSAYTWGGANSFGLNFNSGGITVDYHNRADGYRVEPTFE